MDPFRIFVSFLSLLCFYSVPCSLVTCWEKADLLALVCVLFVVALPIDVPGQVWYMIVSITDFLPSSLLLL